MTDNDVINAMRSESASLPAVAINKLIELKGGKIDQFEMIRIFKEAFPEIPLRTLNEASTSRLIVGADGIDDEELNNLLSPWLLGEG